MKIISNINENPYIKELLDLFTDLKSKLDNLEGYKLNFWVNKILKYIPINFPVQGIFFKISAELKSWLKKLMRLNNLLDDGLRRSFCEDIINWMAMIQYSKNNYFIFKVPDFKLIKLINHLKNKTKDFFLSTFEFRAYDNINVDVKIFIPSVVFYRLIGSCLINEDFQVIVECFEINKLNWFKISFINLKEESWENITSKSLYDIIDFIDDLFLFKTKKKFLNELSELREIQGLLNIIQEQLKFIFRSKTKSFRFNDKIWKENSRFQLSTFYIDKNQLDFNRFNIFIGKNNTGKTHALTRIFEFLKQHERKDLFKPQKIFMSQQDTFFNSNIKVLEAYYIPKERKLEPSNASIQDFQENMLLLLKTIDKKAFSIKRGQQWIIKDLPRLLRIFFTSFEWKGSDFEISESLSPIEREIFKRIWRIIVKLKRIFLNWNEKIGEFFSIDIRNPENITTTSYVIPSYSIYLNKQKDWTNYGSGTQELINLIFFVEVLKELPALNFSELITALEIKDPYNIQESFLHHERNNRFLLIDEPEISLHPELLRKFFKYLKETSEYVQVFIATHSPLFLELEEIDKNCSITLFQIKQEYKFIPLSIQKENILKAYDELYNYDAKEAALFLARNSYDFLLSSTIDLQDLNMIKKINNYRNNQKDNIYDILELGTSNENPTPRLIQNVLLLISTPENLNLNGNNESLTKPKKIFICQVNSFKELEYKEIMERRPSKIKPWIWRFLNLCNKLWSEEGIRKKALIYNEMNSSTVQDKIKIYLEMIKNKLDKERSILVFPENALPYDFLEYIINFAKSNGLVIVGGMEHQKIDYIELKLNKLSTIYPGAYKGIYNYKSFNPQGANLKRYRKNFYINQAIIINSNGNFCFQIKNIPTLLDGIPELIPISLYPQFRKIKTMVGDISIFICKDFLVNNRVINKWMEKNNITTLIIPSFTKFVSPFLNKFGDIVYSNKKHKHTFIFSNIAEYGGSGIFHYDYRYDYEPGEDNLFTSREEGIKQIPPK